MSRKRVFHTWPKHQQLSVLLTCFNLAVKEAESDPGVLDKFKDQKTSKIFKLAAQYNRHLKPEDFDEFRTMTVYELGRNIISGKRTELENQNNQDAV